MKKVNLNKVRTSVSEEIERLKNAAHIIATTDVLLSLAQTAYKNNFTMPEISDNGKIEITDGRHPVVEKMSKNSMFVPNDTLLNNDDLKEIAENAPFPKELMWSRLNDYYIDLLELNLKLPKKFSIASLFNRQKVNGEYVEYTSEEILEKIIGAMK